jgi:glycosyltransferase involved in cell wall biosynthesis
LAARPEPDKPISPALMRVYMNFTETRQPYGGANAFLRSLRDALNARGVSFTHDERSSFDVALLNALTDGLDLTSVRRLADRGRPIVHRKVGYRASGTQELRRVTDGVVHGDRLQIDFTPYLAHSIFQSDYSRDVFGASGFDGAYTVIHNGVDERVFNTRERPHRFSRRLVERGYWDGSEPLRVIVSTWSKDENKGFSDYREIDRRLSGRRDIELRIVGRVPSDTRFYAFDVIAPRRRLALAALLKRQHVLLQLARFETCSNALIEGINCGLPVVYLDSGANAEIADGYGVDYRGDLDEALARLRPRYGEIVAASLQNPYRIASVADAYLSVLRSAAGEKP